MACQRKCNKKLKRFNFEIQLPNYENSYICCVIPDVRGLDLFHSVEVLMGNKAIGIAADRCVQSAALQPVWLVAMKALTINEVLARGIKFRMTAQDVVYSTWARDGEGALAELPRATWSKSSCGCRPTRAPLVSPTCDDVVAIGLLKSFAFRPSCGCHNSNFGKKLTKKKARTSKNKQNWEIKIELRLKLEILKNSCRKINILFENSQISQYLDLQQKTQKCQYET